jgi:PEP-CTERM motif-containing protein
MKRYLIAAACLFSCACVSFASTMAWDVTQTHKFGTLNLATGQFSQISNFGFTPGGIGEVGGSIFTTDGGGNTLFSINKTTGALTAIGDTGSNITYYTFGSTSTGLYMVDTEGGLWNINAKSGKANFIGSTALNMGTSPYVGLSAGGTALYIALGSNVYTINTTTGLASFVGTSGTTDFGALVTVGGTVYASTLVAPNSIYTFNPANGTSTFSTLVAGDYSFGLAPTVPEPSSVALLGIGGLLVAAYAWKRRRLA